MFFIFLLKCCSFQQNSSDQQSWNINKSSFVISCFMFKVFLMCHLLLDSHREIQSAVKTEGGQQIEAFHLLSILSFTEISLNSRLTVQLPKFRWQKKSGGDQNVDAFNYFIYHQFSKSQKLFSPDPNSNKPPVLRALSWVSLSLLTELTNSS